MTHEKTFCVGAAPGKVIFYSNGKPLFATTTEAAEAMLKDLPRLIALSHSLRSNLNTADPIAPTQPTINWGVRFRQFIANPFNLFNRITP